MNQLSFEDFIRTEELKTRPVTPSRSLTAEELAYLKGPVIYHAGGWEMGGVIAPRVPEARLALILAGEESMCTLEEALCYLSSASMAAPLHQEYADIFFWLGQEVLPRVRELDQPYHTILGHDQPFALSAYLQNEFLNPLRRNIRAAVIKHAKARK